MEERIYSITVQKLYECGMENIPAELISSKNLVYSSPATLAFNSPGAKGFGVKRAGLSIPGSVMLLVSPGCCGRNTAMLSEIGEYADRFFYLTMDDTDIVTGRHLNKIKDAVLEIGDFMETMPTVVMICITCVDALLGTDMDMVCKKITEKTGITTLPCYMYALTREGRMPPMVAVRKTIYSLLEPKKKKSTTVNLLGEFSPFMEDMELYDLLKSIGIKKINEISRCKDFNEYLDMAEANFNLVLNPECRIAAEDIRKRLGIPEIELTRVYDIDKIHKQYVLLGSILGETLHDEEYYEKTKNILEEFKNKYNGISIAIGECLNGCPFEMALSFTRYGFKVKAIYATVSDENYIYIKELAKISPDTKVYTNLSPTMLYYDGGMDEVDIAIGADAAYYHSNTASVLWNDEKIPFGYAGLNALLGEMKKALEVCDEETA